MAEVTVTHEIHCDENTFWHRCFFDAEYNKKLFFERLKFPNFEILSESDDDTKRTKKVRIEPPAGNLPGPVKKLLGDKLGYVEEGTLDKKTGKYTFFVTPSTLAEKTKITGEITCQKKGEKSILRTAKIKVEVKVFAVGGMVEDRIINDLKSSYEAAAHFTDEWVKEKGY